MPNSKLAYCLPIIPVGSWLLGSFLIFNICLRIFVNNNNKYSYSKLINAKFEISILVNL